MLRNATCQPGGLAIIIFFLLALPAYSVDEMVFRWALIKHHDSAPDQVVDFSETPVVRSGDEFRVFIEPLSGAHIYLYLYDSEKNLSLLFPADFSVFSSDEYNGQASYIPPPGNWFTIPNSTGTERFYLLASEQRLEALEQLTTDYYASPHAESRAALWTEIKSLRKKYSQLTAEAEVGVPIAGTIKSYGNITPDLPANGPVRAVEVHAHQFYGKTIRLKHE